MPGSSSHQPSILYVDDQPSHRALFAKAFGADFNILIASSGEEGLKILREQPCFLVVADNHMPQMSGIDFLTHVKTMDPRTQRAILSAYDSPQLKEEARQRAGVEDCLSKPWRREQIRPFLQKAWQGYQQTILDPETAIQPPPGQPAPGQPAPGQPAPAPFSWGALCRFLDEFGDVTNHRGARRVKLTYVEPPLKRYVATVRRPCPEPLKQALEAAQRADLKSLEQGLTGFVQEFKEQILLLSANNLS